MMTYFVIGLLGGVALYAIALRPILWKLWEHQEQRRRISRSDELRCFGLERLREQVRR